MHLTVLTSSTAMKEGVGCNDLSLHKLELGANLRVRFPRNNNIGIQIATLPWQLLMVEFWDYHSLYPGNSFSDTIWDVPFYLAICAELFETYRILHRVGGLFVVLRFQILVCRYSGFIVYV